MKKALITGISNDGRFNRIALRKSRAFLDHLQDFLLEIGVVKKKGIGNYERNGKTYDIQTFYLIHWEDIKNRKKPIVRKLSDFKDAELYRYHSKKIEFLIIFSKTHIKLIFYCDTKNRQKINKALFKFCNVKKPFKEKKKSK
ncbi:MAG: hypothetical protein QGH47_01300 [Candidatus Woesearchaeota archaeon]|jgi:hypothetical protein|nr:hypothetical protein [Candidatus Woesearchaeota archaeon]